MNAQDYAEWCRLSGLYVANYSHLDRYRTYAKVLSPAGVTVAIVSEFLADASPSLDPIDWRTNRVYEPGSQQDERVKLTATALAQVGAPALAQSVATAQNKSPFAALAGLMSGGNPGGLPDLASLAKSVNPLDMLQALQASLTGNSSALSEPDLAPEATASKRETRSQVEELLEQFTQAHAAELRQDIERHGDPRLVAGYSLDGRMKELDVLQKRYASHQAQRDAIETVTKVMAKIPKLIAQKTEGKEKKAATHLKQLVRTFQEQSRELRKVPAEDRCPEWTKIMPQVEAFEASQTALVKPDVFGNSQLKQAAEAIGPVVSKTNRKTTELAWDKARGLECDWTTFALVVSVPAKSQEAMSRALQAVEHLRAEFGALQQQWRAQVLDSFREIYQGQLLDDELDEYELDAQGEPTDEAILGHVNSGDLYLSATDATGSDFTLVAHLDVEWDPEHGLELVSDVDFHQEEASSATGSSIPGSSPLAGEALDLHGLTFERAGPPLTAADLDGFEAAANFKLPSDYREFLLHTNGGVPAKTQLVISMHGDEQLWTIERFLSLTLDPNTSSSANADSLPSALRLPTGASLQSHLLPIARARQGTFPPRAVGNPLLCIVLQGKRAGRVILFEADGMLPPAEDVATEKLLRAALDDAIRSPITAAPTLSKLCKKLQPATAVNFPEWVRFIRENQVDAFLNWLARGGSLKERFKDRSEPFQPSVVDLVAAEGSPELLERLTSGQRISARQLLESWQGYMPQDIPRFEQLMAFLPPADWSAVLTSPAVWDHPSVWEKLAGAGVDFNMQFHHERRTPLQLAILAGRKEAVRWLLDHGADPHKQDRFHQDSFQLATTALGRACLPVLQAHAPPIAAPDSTDSAAAQIPGLVELTTAANQLPADKTLRLVVEMTSPPVTQLEQVYYAEVGCHYRLTFELGNTQVTYNDTRSPRQDYLHAPNWPDALFSPIVQWPQLTPLWDTLQVVEFEFSKAVKSRKYTPTPRPDLSSAARSTLEQAFTRSAARERRPTD
jgi:hypothetical protein